MKVLLFGATGMVGQGVLLECLRDPEVSQVITIGRTTTGMRHPKLQEVVHRNFANYSCLQHQFVGFDACFFCLGVSAAGMSEEDYTRITYGFTLAAATALSHVHPGMTFVYVSGQDTGASEQGRIMWARVKGRTENALLRLPLKAYMLRPGVIQPLDGIRSKTQLYRVFYAIAKPILPLLHRIFPNHIVTTRELGQAMLILAKKGAPTQRLETHDIRALLNGE